MQYVLVRLGGRKAGCHAGRGLRHTGLKNVVLIDRMDAVTITRHYLVGILLGLCLAVTGGKDVAEPDLTEQKIVVQ